MKNILVCCLIAAAVFAHGCALLETNDQTKADKRSEKGMDAKKIEVKPSPAATEDEYDTLSGKIGDQLISPNKKYKLINYLYKPYPEEEHLAAIPTFIYKNRKYVLGKADFVHFSWSPDGNAFAMEIYYGATNSHVKVYKVVKNKPKIVFDSWDPSITGDFAEKNHDKRDHGRIGKWINNKEIKAKVSPEQRSYEEPEKDYNTWGWVDKYYIVNVDAGARLIKKDIHYFASIPAKLVNINAIDRVKGVIVEVGKYDSYLLTMTRKLNNEELRIFKDLFVPERQDIFDHLTMRIGKIF